MLSRRRMSFLLPLPLRPAASYLSIVVAGPAIEGREGGGGVEAWSSINHSNTTWRTYSLKANIYSKSGKVQDWPRNLFVYNVVVKCEG